LKAFTREVGVEEEVIFTGNEEHPFVPLKLCDIYTHITLGEGCRWPSLRRSQMW
jgi:hypothetical protein